MAKHIRIKQKPPVIVPVPVKKDWKEASRKYEEARRANRLLFPVGKIIQTVATTLGVGEIQIMGERRDANTVTARHIAQYLASELTGMTYADIGRLFKRDHTSVRTAHLKLRAAISRDPAFAAQIEDFKTKLASVSALSESSAPGDPTSPQPKSPGATIHDDRPE